LKIFALTIKTELGNEDILEAIIDSEESEMSVLGYNTEYKPSDENMAYTNIYSETENDAKNNLDFINKHLAEYEIIIEKEYEIKEMEEDDYLYSYVNFLKPFNVGSLTVVPNLKNEDNIDMPKPVIYIGKQYAFGTGTHETTFLALTLIDYYKNNVTHDENIDIADIGSGSGILSLASYLLLSKNITAVDNDEVAVSCTIDNIEYNDIEIDKKNIFAGSADTLHEMKKDYDFVIANIETDVLIEIMPHLFNILRDKNSYLLLSGILEAKKYSMIKCIQNFSIDIVKQINKGEWNAFLCKVK
jgi:ribosomal protein L11 methyltransferase